METSYTGGMVVFVVPCITVKLGQVVVWWCHLANIVVRPERDALGLKI